VVQLSADEVPGEPRQSEVNWWVDVYGANGVTHGDVTITPDSTNSSRAAVSIPPGTEGEVMVYANYISTTGNIVLGRAFKAASIGPSAAMAAIELRPASTSAITGDNLFPDLWAAYVDGITRQLFPDEGALVFQTSNAAIVEIGLGGYPVAKAPGTATVQATYNGFTASMAVTVTAPPLPVILRQPQGRSVGAGARVVLDVTADGGGQTLSYQWRRNGVALDGYTDETMVIENASETDVGFYSVLVSGPGGSVISANASLVVDDLLLFGPDSAGYVGRRRTGAPMQDISATGTAILQNADDAAIPIPLGFAFSFYGVSRSSAYISSNGLITFGSGETDYLNADLSAVPVPRPTIAVAWDVWYTN
jgi:hypothetical protein